MKTLPTNYFIAIDIPTQKLTRGYVRDITTFFVVKDTAIKKFNEAVKQAKKWDARSVTLYEGNPPKDKYNIRCGDGVKLVKFLLRV